MWKSRLFQPVETEITCPSCRAASLAAHFSCLQTSFVCPACNTRYHLEDIAAALDAADFARLEASLGDRLSDRL